MPFGAWWVLGLYGVLVGAFAAFAWPFRHHGDAVDALERMARNVPLLRWGILPPLVGIAGLAEAQALRMQAGAGLEDPVVLSLTVSGYVLILGGLAILNDLVRGTEVTA